MKMLLLLSQIVMVVLLRGELASSLDCSSMDPALVTEIASYNWLSQALVDALITPGGSLKGQTYAALADFTDKFGSRYTGTQNLEDSIDYMIAQLTALGFNNAHGEDATVPIWIRGTESLTLVEPRVKTLAMLGLGGSVGTPPDGITADVIVVKSFSELDARASEVPGKIVVYNNPYLGYGISVQYREQGANHASKYGAVATLVRSVTPMSIYSPHTGWQDYNTTEAPIMIPAASITVEDAQMFQRMVDRGDNVRVTLNMEAVNMPDGVSRNTVGEIGGATLPEQVVIVSGHLDSWDVGQGSMDDGGGAFVGIYAALALKSLGFNPARTLRSVLWTAEEQVLVGSRAYAAQHVDELDNFSIVMESDEGTFLADGFSFTGTDSATCIIQEILKLAAPMNATKLTRPDQGSDTSAFTAYGVPAGAILNENQKYFLFHHSNGDTMTVEDPDELDSCVAITALISGVLANLSILLPRV